LLHRIPIHYTNIFGEFKQRRNRALLSSMRSQQSTTLSNTEKALRESQERYELAVKGSCAGLWDWNIKTSELYWSPRVKEIMGIKDMHFVPNFNVFEKRIHPEDHTRTMGLLNRHLSERVPYDIEYRLRHDKGHYIWVIARGQAIWDDDGKPTRMAGSVYDITTRKIAEHKLKASHQQMRMLWAKIQTIQEQERKRIAREIHDQFGQLLTSFKIDLHWLSDHLPTTETAVVEVANRLKDDCDNMLNQVRELASLLRPAILDDFGITAALEWLAEDYQNRNNIKCFFKSNIDSENFDNTTSTALFRICQEALTNVARHAEATQVDIEIDSNGKHITLSVKDNGKGVPPAVAEKKDSLGIVGMRERAAVCGGRLKVKRLAPNGTAIIVNVPIDKT